MERKANKTCWRAGERKRDDCRGNRGQYKALSDDLLGTAEIGGHVNQKACSVLLWRLSRKSETTCLAKDGTCEVVL